MNKAAPPSVRRDVLSAYVAAGARVGSWAIISAIVFRRLGPYEFALLALARATVGIISYVSQGLLPATIHAVAGAGEAALARQPDLNAAAPAPEQQVPVLSYYTPSMSEPAITNPYRNARAVAAWISVSAFILIAYYAMMFDYFHRVASLSLASEMPAVVLLIGISLLLRLNSDPAGAILQTHDRITLDNWMQAGSEVAWVGLVGLLLLIGASGLTAVAFAQLLSSLLFLTVRCWEAGVVVPEIRGGTKENGVRARRELLHSTTLIALAHLADFLYAPVGYILINHLLSGLDVASYAPAVQIDSGLAMLTIGLASALLPRTAVAHAAGDVAAVKRYYVKGTLLSIAIVLPISLMVWLLSPWIFRLWLGNDMPVTRAILPLVLLHNLIGSSSIVGRSILLGTGKFRALTTAVLIAGVTNVVLGYVFLRYTNLGLYGIVLATIVAVTARCAIWQPWYVMRSIRRAELERVPAPIDMAEMEGPGVV